MSSPRRPATIAVARQPSRANRRAAARARLLAWFASRGWRAAPFQKAAWQAGLDGRSGLIHTPPGSGKTLAALGAPLIDAAADLAVAVTNASTGRLRLLWITPLRALATDSQRAIAEAVTAMGLPWTVALRTGDATAADRNRVRKGRAEVVVITPESLALLLSWPDAEQLLANLADIVVDEWHDLLGSRRGVALQLALARIRRLRPAVRLWGLSATLGNLDEAMTVLLPGRADAVRIDAARPRPVRLRTLIPDESVRLPWAGQLGLMHLGEVLAAIMKRRSSLLFTTTRAQAERWHEALASIWPEAASTLALHHGSLDPALRAAAEAGLRSGQVRCVVTTASLDLGVDFPTVDQVIQIGSPRSALRLIQRAGRSRHRPGETGEVLGVPTHALELLEFAAARDVLARGQVEPRHPLTLSLDVLAQHCVTLAVGGGFAADALLAEVRTTHAFAALTDSDWQAVLQFITQGGTALARYPEYRRVVVADDGCYRVIDRTTANRHRQNLGTIVADGAMTVRMLRGGRLGTVEERFIGQLKPGDRFRFSGRLLELARVEGMIAWVRLAKGESGLVAVWQGGQLPMSDALGFGIERVFADAAVAAMTAAGATAGTTTASAPARAVAEPMAGQMTEHPPLPAEVRASLPLLRLQAARSALPGPGRLLTEQLQSRRGHHLAIYPFAGRAAHTGLAVLLAGRLSRARPDTIDYAVNDYGFMLTRDAPFDVDADTLRTWLAPGDVDAELRAGLNHVELARRHFRGIAQVAGLVQARLAGSAIRPARQLQTSSGLLHDVLRRHDPDHLLLRLADHEVLHQQLDRERVARVLARAQQDTLLVIRTPALSPLGFALWAERERGQSSNEDWQVRVQREAARQLRGKVAA